MGGLCGDESEVSIVRSLRSRMVSWGVECNNCNTEKGEEELKGEDEGE